MEEKLIIAVRETEKSGSSVNVVKISKKALALVRELCAETNRTQQDIVSRLIEWAYDRVEIQRTEDDGGDN